MDVHILVLFCTVLSVLHVAQIVRVLREEMAQLRAEAEFALAECWRQAVRWESGASRVQLTLALERIPAAPPDDEDEDEDENGCSTAGADSGYRLE